MNKQNKCLLRMYAFYLVYYAVNCFGGYYGKYLGELGMTDGQIGLLINGTMLLGMLFQPLWGMLADRSRSKRNVLSLVCGLAGLVSLLVDGASGFAPLFVLIFLINTLLLPASPVLASLSIEYTAEIGKEYGPVRMIGTIGYILGAGLLGAVLTHSLRGMFFLSGGMLLLCAGMALLLPPVPGHQRGAARVSPFRILRDRRIALMLAFVTIGSITTTFYGTFFTKRLGELHFDNGTVSLIIMASTLLEIPFLFLADKLMKKLSVWIWILIGFGLNGLRWLGLWQAASLPLILLCQLPSVLGMACVEYFPTLYIHSRTSPELKSSAQTMISLLCYGSARVIGGLLGGLLADRFGIAGGFMACGILLLGAFAVAFAPCCRLARLERAEQAAALTEPQATQS